MQTENVELRVEASALLEVADARGKHRIQAELKRLEQEARFLEGCSIAVQEGHCCDLQTSKEMEELDKTDRVSIACQELLLYVEAKPDPFLPITVGPANAAWDRWFEGPQDSQGCRCWIL